MPKYGNVAFLIAMIFALFVHLNAAAQDNAPKPSSSSQETISIFYRAESPVTWQNITQPFRDIDQHIMESMGWKKGFREEFEASIAGYFTTQNMPALLEFSVRAGIALVLALLLWRAVSPLFTRFHSSLEEKPEVSGRFRWARGAVRFAQDVLFWGLFGSFGSIIVWFFPAQDPPRITAISILTSVVVYQTGRSALTVLLNPESSKDRLLQFRDQGARHFFRYFNRMLFFTALWWPVVQFFNAIDYHGEFETLLWTVFRFVIFLLLLLLFSNKQLIIESIPARGIGRPIAGWIRTLFPAILSLIVGIFGLYILGYIRLAQFVLVSLIYSSALFCLAVGLVRWISRLRQLPVVEAGPEEQV